MNGTNVHNAGELISQDASLLSAEERKAAVWVLEHLVDAASLSLREIARQSAVHPNTITRLIRKSGHDGFKAFQVKLRHHQKQSVNFPDRAAWLQSLQGETDLEQLFAQLAQDSTSNVESVFRDLNAGRIEAAARVISGAKDTYVLGVGMAHSLAENFAYMTSMALPNVRAVPAAGSLPVDALAMARKGDVLLAMTFKPYRTEVVEAVRVAQAQGVTVIAVSDSPAAPILAGTTHQFIVPTKTPQFFTSTIALAAFLETLMAFVIASSGPDAVDSIKRLHERRHELGIYWERE